MGRETRLRIARGDAATFDISASKGDGTAQDITGSSLWFTAKHRLDDEDGDAVIAKSTGAGGVAIVDGPAGLARVTLAPADTEGLTSPTTLHWDVQAKDPSNAIRTLARGRLYVDLDVTRATS